MGIVLGIGIGILLVVIALVFFFKSAYHTYHGDLPNKFTAFLVILGSVALLVLGAALVLPHLLP